MTRPIRASIELDALRHNCLVARRHAGNARLWAVLKANAYGHGLLRAALALSGCADGIALIEIEGAVALRAAGIRLPILLLEGFYSAGELPMIVEHELTPVVHSLHQVELLTTAMLGSKASVPVYLKLNTGMNRLGLNENELPATISALQAAPQVGHITLMTHFADADCEPDGRGIAPQMSRLNALRASLANPVSLANSAAILRYPDSLGGQDAWVRAGIMLYGGSPFPNLKSASDLDLRPVMTLTSEVIAVRDLQPGDRIGYGGSFVATHPMRVGIVACGYADGYPRHAPTGTPVLVQGQRSRTLGRVSMDKICVDLTGIAGAGLGSAVVLWGKGLPADEVATAAGTISYELFCALATRVKVVEV